MTDRARMYIKLAIFLTITAGIGVALYFLLFVTPPSVLPNDTTAPTPSLGGLPSAQDGRPQGSGAGADGLPGNDDALTPSPVANGGLTANTLLTTAGIRAPQASPTGGATYYDPNDGRFYRINDKGEVEALDGLVYPNASRVAVAPNSNAALVEFPDGSNIVVDFSTKKQHTLPAHWEDFHFSPDSTAIAAKSMPADVNNRALLVTSVDGSTTTVVAALGANANRVYPSLSPTKDIVGFSATGTGGTAFGQNTVYLVSPSGEALSGIVVNGTSFKSRWSPNATNFFYSVADAGDDYRPSLWYSDVRGDRAGAIRLRLPVKTTADKCVFASESTVYCAVPAETPANSGADTSLFRGGDSLVQIALPSGTTRTLATLQLVTPMNNLSLSADGSTLYYTDLLNRLNLLRLR